jgi:hypothetical protein
MKDQRKTYIFSRYYRERGQTYMIPTPKMAHREAFFLQLRFSLISPGIGIIAMTRSSAILVPEAANQKICKLMQ